MFIEVDTERMREWKNWRKSMKSKVRDERDNKKIMESRAMKR